MNEKAKALREKDAEAIREELLQLRRELFNLRMQHAVQQSNKTGEFRRVRRAIARAATVLAEKTREAA
jgi:large subunit ribosomal protein L29